MKQFHAAKKLGANILSMVDPNSSEDAEGEQIRQTYAKPQARVQSGM